MLRVFIFAAVLVATSLASSPRYTVLSAAPQTALESTLNAALAAWNQGNPGATRGQLNTFETLVQSQAGQLLSHDQAGQLIALAEAAYALT